MSEGTIKKLKLAARIEIARVMVDAITRHDDGTCSYHEGWSDKRVAEAVGKPEYVNAVATVRKELYGNLAVVRTATHNGLEKRTAELEREIESLKLELQVFRAQVAPLLQLL